MELEPYEKEKKFVDHVIDATERGNSTHTVLSKQFTIIFNIMSMYVVCVNENIFLNQWSLYNLLYFNEFHSDVSTLFRFTSYKYTSCLAILLLFIVFFFFFLFHLCMFRLYSRIKMNNLCFALKSSDDELKLKWMQQEKKKYSFQLWKSTELNSIAQRTGKLFNLDLLNDVDDERKKIRKTRRNKRFVFMFNSIANKGKKEIEIKFNVSMARLFYEKTYRLFVSWNAVIFNTICVLNDSVK